MTGDESEAVTFQDKRQDQVEQIQGLHAIVDNSIEEIDEEEGEKEDLAKP